eukprot:scaffold75006_cov36-Tisochrysis_lutea.AAC.1
MEWQKSGRNTRAGGGQQRTQKRGEVENREGVGKSRQGPQKRGHEKGRSRWTGPWPPPKEARNQSARATAKRVTTRETHFCCLL